MLSVYNSCGVCHMCSRSVFAYYPCWCSLCGRFIWGLHPARCAVCRRNYHPICLRESILHFRRMDERQRETFDDDSEDDDDNDNKTNERNEKGPSSSSSSSCPTESIYLDPSVEAAIDRIPFDFPERVLPHQRRYRHEHLAARQNARLKTVMTIFFEVMKGKDIRGIAWAHPFKLYDFFLQQLERFEASLVEFGREMDAESADVYDIHYANVYADATYGNESLMSYMTVADTLTDEIYLDRILKCLHIESRDKDGFVEDLFNDHDLHHIPTFFIAVDHRWRKIILAIRGTLTMNDALIDVVNIPVVFGEGHTHTGVAHSVRCVCDIAFPTLQRLKSDYPDYPLVVTGHSLGGAVAVVLHTMWKAEVFPCMKVYTFGAPACVTPELAAKCAPCDVFQTVHEMDNLPRTSMECIDQMIALLGDIDETLNEHKKTCLHALLRARRHRCASLEKQNVPYAHGFSSRDVFFMFEVGRITRTR
eukprot:PhM_4_TR11998/c0_g1_i1/m.72963